ncbi:MULTISPECIES: proline dehydrogenase family protein [unclassified Polaribacter]|uniref:proline dehydrogenase family protein n=1 Tax=unclassified Polaribacter TaxID=196858 RepID=UPI0011BE3591|nr:MULTISPECIES: proline dehydrogenase family protein [unclassified Polaribacter]TXD50912.1 proline dehydrogenase [Polaribacter sp. IC063]TXD62295.1 proline dehydrogenase [Polaribacter sp. IC066]
MKQIFDNTEIALALKSNYEIDRAQLLFKMITRDRLVKIGSTVAKFVLKANLPVEKLIRITVFNHFCGGISEEDCTNTVNKLFSKKVYAVLDYSAEGKEEEVQFGAVQNKILNTLEYAKSNSCVPFVVFKPTGLGRFKIFQKQTENILLTTLEKQEWETIVKRFDTICARASAYNIPVLIDAEESWMQDAADNLIEKMMEKYNKQRAIVFNTLQVYRWDRLIYLKELHERAKQCGFKIGMKLVRGAYMEKERKRAQENGYKDPICINKIATDNLYNDTLKYMVENVNDIEIFAGTHNEESSYLLMSLLEKNNIATNDHRIWFGQLFGMSDHISFNLSNDNYNVAKYLPYGPVKDVMPYLIRRAEENSSVAGQTTRELYILKKEKERRKLKS